MLARPVADIASFPAPGWTDTPLFEKVNSEDPDDSAFITGLAPGAEDPQVALQIGELDIPYGASGRIIARARMRWNQALSQSPDTVRVGIGRVSDLGVDDPTLLFVRSLASFTETDFETIEIPFDYTDFAADSDTLGIYVEMTPHADDAGSAVGHVSWMEVESCVPAMIVGQCPLGTLTARDVIQQARDHHPSFQPRAHPNGALLRLLSNYQREITAKLAQVNPALLATPITITLPLADFDKGVLLPAHVYAMPGVEVRHKQGTDVVDTINLVNLTLRADHEIAHQTAYLRGNRLYLTGRKENWQAFDQLRMHAVLVPEALTSLDDRLVLPDFGADAYVAALVQKMAIRGGIGEPLISMSAGMEQRFMDAVGQQMGAQVSHTRDVFPGRF